MTRLFEFPARTFRLTVIRSPLAVAAAGESREADFARELSPAGLRQVVCWAYSGFVADASHILHGPALRCTDLARRIAGTKAVVVSRNTLCYTFDPIAARAYRAFGEGTLEEYLAYAGRGQSSMLAQVRVGLADVLSILETSGASHVVVIGHGIYLNLMLLELLEQHLADQAFQGLSAVVRHGVLSPGCGISIFSVDGVPKAWTSHRAAPNGQRLISETLSL